MKPSRFVLVLRVAIALGFCIDAYVATLLLFAPGLVEPLLDIPVRDPLMAQFAGGEFVVAAIVYALAFRAPARYRALLWVCAADQAFAAVLPALAVAHGAIPASVKTVAPIPFSVLLVALYAVGALRPGAKRSATPSMQ